MPDEGPQGARPEQARQQFPLLSEVATTRPRAARRWLAGRHGRAAQEGPGLQPAQPLAQAQPPQLRASQPRQDRASAPGKHVPAPHRSGEAAAKPARLPGARPNRLPASRGRLRSLVPPPARPRESSAMSQARPKRVLAPSSRRSQSKLLQNKHLDAGAAPLSQRIEIFLLPKHQVRNEKKRNSLTIYYISAFVSCVNALTVRCIRVND
jgi:hypothetical protein